MSGQDDLRLCKRIAGSIGCGDRCVKDEEELRSHPERVRGNVGGIPPALAIPEANPAHSNARPFAKSPCFGDRILLVGSFFDYWRLVSNEVSSRAVR